MTRRLLLLPLLLIITACDIAGDKFPYPPQFVSVDDVCPCELGAPPAVGSTQQKKEMAFILDAQKKLTPAQKAQIRHEDHIKPEMMLQAVMGENYTRESYPTLYTLLGHSASDAWRIGDNTQDFWGRTRPWLQDSRVELLVKSITRPSYPSGHSTTNHVWAHVLAEVFPAKKSAFFNRAYSIGMHRVKAGVHYQSDVEAGKRLAKTIYEAMKQTASFKAELAAAKQEVARGKPANDNKHTAAKTPANCNKAESDSMVMCR